MKIFKIGIVVILALIFMRCTKPYQPPAITVNSNYLVVEGLINTGSDSTFFKISRTVLLSQGVGTNPEKGADVHVENEANQSFPLSERTPGEYFAPPLNLPSNQKYRLRVKTSSGSVYLSDFVEAKTTPPIDSITYGIKDKGLQIYANAHDANKKTVYYRYEYAEAWQFNALYKSDFISDGKELRQRNMTTENIYTCWNESNSSTIVLGSSAKLEQDVIHQLPVTFIPSESEKLSVKYSTLLKQYALTKEAYDFWENLKKNTESLGSIFDAQPSQLTGNIHNIDHPEEPVIGYVSAGTVSQKRVFIPKEKLPAWKTKYPFDCGEPDTVWISAPITGRREEDIYFHKFLLVPLTAIYSGGSLVGHFGSSKECADCTIRGTNKRPAFWQ